MEESSVSITSDLMDSFDLNTIISPTEFSSMRNEAKIDFTSNGINESIDNNIGFDSSLFFTSDLTIAPELCATIPSNAFNSLTNETTIESTSNSIREFIKIYLKDPFLSDIPDLMVSSEAYGIQPSSMLNSLKNETTIESTSNNIVEPIDSNINHDTSVSVTLKASSNEQKKRNKKKKLSNPSNIIKIIDCNKTDDSSVSVTPEASNSLTDEFSGNKRKRKKLCIPSNIIKTIYCNRTEDSSVTTTSNLIVTPKTYDMASSTILDDLKHKTDIKPIQNNIIKVIDCNFNNYKRRYQSIIPKMVQTSEGHVKCTNSNIPINIPVTSYIAVKCYQQECPNSATSLCSYCESTMYCSTKCQDVDWPVSHFRNCRMVKKLKPVKISVYREQLQ